MRKVVVRDAEGEVMSERDGSMLLRHRVASWPLASVLTDALLRVHSRSTGQVAAAECKRTAHLVAVSDEIRGIGAFGYPSCKFTKPSPKLLYIAAVPAAACHRSPSQATNAVAARCLMQATGSLLPGDKATNRKPC